MRIKLALAGLLPGVLMLAGCADHAAVPPSAQLMTEGQQKIVFRPTEHGRVYVTDRDTSRILYQAEVNRGETVEVDSTRDEIRVDGRVVSERGLDGAHRYRMYFEPLSRERSAKYRY